MFTHPSNEMISPLPYMSDRERYHIWRNKRNFGRDLDSCNRMAWIGDDALKTQVTQYLYENTVDRMGADSQLLHDLRETFECRWCQLVITLALGLDEEVYPPLAPLMQGMNRLHPHIKAYADILESYIGGLYSKDREAAEDWISTLIRRFYRDLMKEVDAYLAPWSYPGQVLDVTCIRLHIDWSPYYGPILELKPKRGYHHIPPKTKPLLETCFALTALYHVPRLMRHPIIDPEVIRTKRVPRDKFSESFRRNGTDAPRTTALAAMPTGDAVSTVSMPSLYPFPPLLDPQYAMATYLGSSSLSSITPRVDYHPGMPDFVDLTQDEDDLHDEVLYANGNEPMVEEEDDRAAVEAMLLTSDLG